MKRASDLHSLMQMNGVQCNAIMIGSISLAHEPLIISVELHEPKRQDASGAWYKHRDWRGYDNNDYYIINDLLGERRPITQEQYQDDNFVSP